MATVSQVEAMVLPPFSPHFRLTAPPMTSIGVRHQICLSSFSLSLSLSLFRGFSCSPPPPPPPPPPPHPPNPTHIIHPPSITGSTGVPPANSAPIMSGFISDSSRIQTGSMAPEENPESGRRVKSSRTRSAYAGAANLSTIKRKKLQSAAAAAAATAANRCRSCRPIHTGSHPAEINRKSRP